MRCLLIVFSLFITLSVHSQETDTLLSQYPILGYYRLDMTYEEHYNQASKMKEECSMKDSIGIVRHLILIVQMFHLVMMYVQWISSNTAVTVHLCFLQEIHTSLMVN